MAFGTDQNWPLLKLRPWYNGPYGIDGAESALGVRTEGRPVVLYVDDTHPRANDNNWGTHPLNPKETVQSAVDSIFLVEGSLIVVAAEASITESVTIGPARPTNCTIMGVGGNRHQPTWAPATAPGIALTVQQMEWTIEGFTFELGSLGTAIRLSEDPLQTPVHIAYKTLIRNCQFDGLFGGQYGVDFYGAPHRVTIEDCEFIEFHTGASDAFAICTTDSAHTNANQCRILNNMFWQNDNHIGSVGGNRSFNASEFRGNTFMALGDVFNTTIKLDLRGGSVGLNIVTQNVFCGDYAHGGYWANAAAPGMWVGNIAEDLLEPEVADNGFTVAIPAA